MQIGVVREIKSAERRVGLTPESVAELTHRGHGVSVERGAGLGVGAEDEAYRTAGATILDDAAAVFAAAEMIVKVKEPLAVERAMLREDQLLFAYLHLASDAEQTRDLAASGAVCIAYETVTDRRGGLPLLKPMSQIAGRLSVQAGAGALEAWRGGRGVLLGGVPGVAPAQVTIIGGGAAGSNAAQIAVGMGAEVTIIDRDLDVLERLDARFGGRVKTRYARRDAIAEAAAASELTIGAVLVPGAVAPKVVTRPMLATMKKGAVLLDIAVDQGGCFETSRPTAHEDPTYTVDGIVHYCVANMPGATPRTSSYALNNATLPYVVALAERGWRRALEADPGFCNGLNVCRGKVTCKPVAEALGYDYVAATTALKA